MLQVIDPLSAEGQALQRKKDFKKTVAGFLGCSRSCFLFTCALRLRSLSSKARVQLGDLEDHDGQEDSQASIVGTLDGMQPCRT